ncbi:DUF6468 domain-containing protein [Bradyrhizobium sp.]|uniref:DUF6468 domain-containing protein n=1 Tax=Bradyrhizobium sp. TaxID=376 RepID=UPI003C5068C5
MNHALGLVIESLVAVLLVLTIAYCMVLNSRLKRLKADEHSLKAVIAELITATEIAERAIGGLKLAVRDVNENLGNQLASATEMSDYLKRQLAEGDNVVRRLTKIAIAARPQASAEAEPAQFAPQASDLSPGLVSPSLAAAHLTGSPERISAAKAVAAAAQAFSERRRAGGLAA